MPSPRSKTLTTVIGLEVHAQLLTASKMYCGCSAGYANAAPNSHVCPVCLGLPGALPSINRAAIETCVSTGLALGSTIPPFCKLDRKNYGYPDLPKGYQISQYDLPLCVGGELTFSSGGRSVRAGITRVHIEEDTGRLLHRTGPTGTEISLIDLNRSGVPLMEIVGDPDLASPAEAKDYLIALRQLLRYIGASTGNMEEGAFRCDANVSIRADDGSIVGAKVEIKNMNSFRAVERALQFEEQRQRDVLGSGEMTVQETRGWDEGRAVTVPQRTKEQAHDYRYFPEPDLPPLSFDSARVEAIRAKLPELPRARHERFCRDYGLGAEDADLLSSDRQLADYFEAVAGPARGVDSGRAAANWIANDVLGLQKERNLPVGEMPVSAGQLRELIEAVGAGKLSGRAAKELLPQLERGESALGGAARLNLLALEDDSAMRSAVAEAMAAFPDAVRDFKAGKQAAVGRLIGETMRRTGGRASPDDVRRLLLESLAAE
ncbi:MAG: Asp-tRNA(Asn)/Glu-tRNA(Gln) amidotransferase subunit GatB [Thermomicrobiales bacterium]